MKVAANCLLFGDTVDHRVMARFGDLKRRGFDGAEVPVFNPDAIDVPAIRAAAREHGLELTGYGGWIVLEIFNQDNQAIKTAVSCWRPFFESEDTFLSQGQSFVRRTLGGEPSC